MTAPDDIRRWITLCEVQIDEGRVYRIDWGYSRPVLVITNPSPPQARTLVKAITDQHGGVYIRGLMYQQRVYVWDGALMTHDDILSKFLADVPSSSSDLSTFKITNYTVTGFQKVDYHSARVRTAKLGDNDPDSSRFVRNVLAAIDQLGTV